MTDSEIILSSLNLFILDCNEKKKANLEEQNKLRERKKDFEKRLQLPSTIADDLLTEAFNIALSKNEDEIAKCSDLSLSFDKDIKRATDLINQYQVSFIAPNELVNDVQNQDKEKNLPVSNQILKCSYNETISFVNTKPISLTLDGKKYEETSWKDLYVRVVKLCALKDKAKFDRYVESERYGLKRKDSVVSNHYEIYNGSIFLCKYACYKADVMVSYIKQLINAFRFPIYTFELTYKVESPNN